MKLIPLATTFGLVFLVGLSSAQARPHTYLSHKRVVVEHKAVVKPAPIRALVRHLTDVRLTVLPANHVRTIHAGATYYYHDGIYYLQEPQGYVVVKPVAGLRIATLPHGYVTVRVGRDTLYRFNTTYYRRDNGVYIVV